MVRFAVLALSHVFLLHPVIAQYVVENPAYESRENSKISIKRVRVYPGKIWLDMEYLTYAVNPRIQISDATAIRLPDLGSKSYRVTNRINVNASMTPIVSGKTLQFSVGFALPLAKLLQVQADKDVPSLDFFEKGKLYLDFIDCTDEYRRQNDVSYGSCFNFNSVEISLDVNTWNALYCYGYLENQMQKDEFETTAQFARRTTPQALNDTLREKVLEFEGLCQNAFIYSLRNKKPELTYNADEQYFTVKYPGTEPARVKMPGSEARIFKEGVMNGSIKLSGADMEKNLFGNYVIENFYYKQGSKEIKYSNTLTNANEAIRYSFQTYKKVEKEFIYLQKENGARARIE